jgi:hypothetical protein
VVKRGSVSVRFSFILLSSCGIHQSSRQRAHTLLIDRLFSLAEFEGSGNREKLVPRIVQFNKRKAAESVGEAEGASQTVICRKKDE